MKLCKIFFEA